MIPMRNDESWKGRLDVAPTGTDLAERAVRALRAATADPIRFDLRASARGLAALRPGSGTTEADSAKARAIAERARQQLAEYLAGERSYFSVPVDLSGVPPFQRSVLDAAAAIPFGEVRSYAWIARRIGADRAVRAVGSALGRNPVPIVVPCHRVLRSDGALGGYAFGLPMKRRLLGVERETFALVGSDTVRVVCRHGCPGEQRIDPSHRVVFSSVAEARANGYRPCKRCMPRDVPIS